MSDGSVQALFKIGDERVTLRSAAFRRLCRAGTAWRQYYRMQTVKYVWTIPQHSFAYRLQHRTFLIMAIRSAPCIC